MFTIRSGVLKLVQYLPDGSQRIVRLVRTTDIVGLEAMLEQHYQHDAVVLQPTEVCSLPVVVVNTLSRDNPALHRELFNRWQRALQEADAWITELSTGSAASASPGCCYGWWCATASPAPASSSAARTWARCSPSPPRRRAAPSPSSSARACSSRPRRTAFLLDVPNLQRIAEE